MNQLWTKIKQFVVNHKEKIKQLLLMLLAIAAVTGIVVLILYLFNVVYFDDGIQFNVELFNKFKNSWYGWVILIIFQIVITTVLCFLPGISMAFILLMEALLDYPWQAFLISFIGVMLTSAMMYIVGRFGGYRVCAKLLGEEDCRKASDLLNNRGIAFFPLMMMFPAFPDDALTMIAGTLKMSLKWFIPSVLVGRSIGIATITFGLSIVPFDKFTTIWHWIGFILICAVLIVLVFYLAHRLNGYLYARSQKNAENEASATDLDTPSEAVEERTEEDSETVTESIEAAITASEAAEEEAVAEGTDAPVSEESEQTEEETEEETVGK